jgi:hypothetical protein
MNFRPLNIAEKYELFPQADKLANLVLKKLKYMTSTEQSVASRRAITQSIYLIAKPLSQISKEEVVSANFHAEQWAKYGDINPFRDLSQLQADGVDVIKTLKEIKQTYNELVSVCMQRSPEFMDLVWQVYRRTHQLKVEYHNLEWIINPPERSELEDSPNVIPIPRTDDERLKQYGFNLRLDLDSPLLQKEPFRRIVETDHDYFYGTGRFAFASLNGDIFQTIWDERQKEIPLFKID